MKKIIIFCSTLFLFAIKIEGASLPVSDFTQGTYDSNIFDTSNGELKLKTLAKSFSDNAVSFNIEGNDNDKQGVPSPSLKDKLTV